MASIKANSKDGKIVSFKFRACLGRDESGKQIFPMSKLPDICKRMNVKIGIITVPSPQAQAVCDTLIKSGIMALWNFAPAHLLTPDGVFVKNENMAYSLAVLSKHIEGTLCV